MADQRRLEGAANAAHSFALVEMFLYQHPAGMRSLSRPPLLTLTLRIKAMQPSVSRDVHRHERSVWIGGTGLH